jgi:hypothetical protein
MTSPDMILDTSNLSLDTEPFDPPPMLAYNPRDHTWTRRGEMRHFRLWAIRVILLACVVLGTACAGANGEQGIQGPKGDTGAVGVGVENIVNNGDGTFTVNLTNGTAYATDNFTGPEGEKGDSGLQGASGATGAQGLQGPPGPNMIVAMGNIATDGTINQVYNVASSTWNAAQNRYEITLTGINYFDQNYVTLVTPRSFSQSCSASYCSGGGKLFVYIYNVVGNPVQCPFSFTVLQCP